MIICSIIDMWVTAMLEVMLLKASIDKRNTEGLHQINFSAPFNEKPGSLAHDFA